MIIYEFFFNLHDCTFNHLYAEASVIGKMFPLLKPKINSVYIMTEQVT